MYASKLLDAYKTAKNYIQDKQIAADLNIDKAKISRIRSGRLYLSENEALYLAEETKLDPEMVMIYLAADKCKTSQAKQLWENLAKKLNHQGLQMLSISFMGLLGVFSGSEESLYECALCILC
ncbi:DUF3693 domain-containing protein [Aliivibrio logei]|jgi:transcriptional regulator with XRE-family HTH domain|uniref:Antirepressor n=1 Tax=Aliivibrio logei TaxID=688 RepID=A0A1B9NTT7_ALILO|nr:DUF3693 domain-containing protein [Aliivibrio logei]OCH17118.1 antirepressor [Aliivibrio logei]